MSPLSCRPCRMGRHETCNWPSCACHASGHIYRYGITERSHAERLLRSVLAEYLQHNQIIDGHWYSPNEYGEIQYDNGPAGPDEVALIESLRQEYGIIR